MKQFEKLDLVLKTIAEHKNFIDSKDLFEKLKGKISDYEFTPIVNKLFEDKKIEKKIVDSKTNSNLTPPYYCKVTFDGLLFIEQNGYSGKNQVLKRNKYWKLTKTISNILNSILVLLVAALGVYFSWESRSKDDEIQKQKLRIEKLEKQLNVSFEK